MQDEISNPVSLEDAAKILRGGDICAFATETVYGLGADATNADAVLKVYQAKGRPRFNPLIVHCADMEMVTSLVEMSELAQEMTQFWPGSLSLVLPMRPNNGICDIVTAGLTSLAVRIPAHEQARDLIRAVGKPLAAPSANPSGKLSPTTAAQVQKGFGGKVPVLDGGACTAGVESTIIAIKDGALVQLRAGALARSEIEQKLSKPVSVAAHDSPVSAPGMLASHYAPNASMRLNATAPRPGEAHLAFGPAPAHAGPTCNLSKTGDLVEAARNLFAMLHQLDAAKVGAIAVAPIPETGLGEAINDRLVRAAAPRD